MSSSRAYLLFDPSATPKSWNDRMISGEFAVLCTTAFGGSLMNPDGSPCLDPDREGACIVFGNLAEAKQHCTRQLASHPTLRYSIFDHHGRGKAPLQEFYNHAHAPKGDFTSTVRRWLGVILVGTALILTSAEVITGMGFGWAAMIAAGLAPAGLLCVFIEFFTMVEARRKKKLA
jgi:hypothetical protein